MTSIREQVFEAVLSGYNTNYDISIHTGLKPAQVSTPLNTLEKHKKISRIGYEQIGKYIFIKYAEFDPNVTEEMLYQSSAKIYAKESFLKVEPFIEVAKPWSANEMDYGRKGQRDTWQQVEAEARSIGYVQGDYLTKLPITIQ